MVAAVLLVDLLDGDKAVDDFPDGGLDIAIKKAGGKVEERQKPRRPIEMTHKVRVKSSVLFSLKNLYCFFASEKRRYLFMVLVNLGKIIYSRPPI